ncbi:MAG: fumarylacetoacetate hydrolase family protein [Pseudomonadota bacterium]
MNTADTDVLAKELYECLRLGTVTDPISDRGKVVSIDDAYQISKNLLAMREADGERVIGKKIGLTNKVVQQSLGVHQPDFGFLTDAMYFASGAKVPLAKTLIQPKAEGEIAFRMGKDLRGPGVTAADVVDATECVMPCFEIVDSRIVDWNITIVDTIADNASCGIFILGESLVDSSAVDFENCEMRLSKRGETLTTGVGSAALGSALNCVAWLANALGEYGVALLKDDIVLSGSLGAMVPVFAGDQFELAIEGVGSCDISFE